MIGIGGVSMSGIAEILAHFGFTVTGSDRSDSEIIRKLISKGISVQIGHDLNNSRKANLVVYTAAVKQDDPELVQAHKFNIPTMERADFLGQITKLYKDTICVSGTHGKTTTTSMVSLCFLKAGFNPTIQVGAILKQIDGNNYIGSKDYFIMEACEYVESFLKFYPKSEIILNIDNDHLDYFKTFDNIKNAFIKYVKLIPKDGLLVINGDDINCLDLAMKMVFINLMYITRVNFMKDLNYLSQEFIMFQMHLLVLLYAMVMAYLRKQCKKRFFPLLELIDVLIMLANIKI